MTTDARQAAVAWCAHLHVSYRTEPCDGVNVRGEIVPNLAVRGWWECDSGCGTRFGPSVVDVAGGREPPEQKLESTFHCGCIYRTGEAPTYCVRHDVAHPPEQDPAYLGRPATWKRYALACEAEAERWRNAAMNRLEAASPCAAAPESVITHLGPNKDDWEIRFYPVSEEQAGAIRRMVQARLPAGTDPQKEEG